MSTIRLRFQGACGYQVFQGYAVQVLHGNERLAIVSSNFVDGADIGMIERRCASCFAAKTFESLGIPGCVSLAGTLKRQTGRARCPGLCKPHPSHRYLIPPGGDSAKRSPRLAT